MQLPLINVDGEAPAEDSEDLSGGGGARCVGTRDDRRCRGWPTQVATAGGMRVCRRLGFGRAGS